MQKTGTRELRNWLARHPNSAATYSNLNIAEAVIAQFQRDNRRLGAEVRHLTTEAAARQQKLAERFERSNQRMAVENAALQARVRAGWAGIDLLSAAKRAFAAVELLTECLATSQRVLRAVHPTTHAAAETLTTTYSMPGTAGPTSTAAHEVDDASITAAATLTARAWTRVRALGPPAAEFPARGVMVQAWRARVALNALLVLHHFGAHAGAEE